MNQATTDLLGLLRDALESEDDSALRRLLRTTRAPDLAEVFQLVDGEDRSRVLFALPPETAAEVVILLREAVRSDVVEELDNREVAGIVAELSPDDAAYFLGSMPEERSEEILEQIPDDISRPIEQLLEYDDYTAGAIMTTEVVAVPLNKTVRDAAEYIRNATHEEDLDTVYVVDEGNRLVGEVPLRRLVTNPPDTKLERIIEPEPVTVFAEDEQETVLQIIRKYDVSSVAVVDRSQRLLGRITHDDLQDVAEEEAEEDLLRMAGTDPAELESSSVLRAARIRLTWLIPCMFGMMITATVLHGFRPQFDVALFATLSVFVPLIGAMGGNSGIQSSTIAVRGLATGELASTSYLRALTRECRIALVMAPVCGCVAWALVAVVYPVLQHVFGEEGGGISVGRVARSVGIAMSCAVVVAAALGLSTPYLFKRLRIDPAIASGPLVTTMNDFVSVTIYMLVAIILAQ